MEKDLATTGDKKSAKPPAKTSPKKKGRVADLIERGNLFAPACPSREIMKHVTSSWGVLVLIALQDGTLRFSELRRKVAGVSERMLAQTLQWLEADGLVSRKVYAEIPPRVEYGLTAMGESLVPHIVGLAAWADEHMPAIKKSRKHYEKRTESVS